MHVIATIFGIALVAFAVAAVVLLLWNSFKVRAEVRVLRAEVARLSGAPDAGTGASQARPGVNTGVMAVPPAPAAAATAAAPPTPPATPAAPPKPSAAPTPPATPAAPKPRRTTKKKPTDTAE